MKRSHRHGFSLIEAAIVLGITGLVIGGLWVAAASVQKQIRFNQNIDLIMAMREKAFALKKTTIFDNDPDTSESFLIVDVLKTISPPFSIHNSANLYNGRQYYSNPYSGLFTVSGGGTVVMGPYMTFTVTLDVTDPTDSMTMQTSPELCIKLSNFLMKQNLGRAPVETHPSVQPHHSIAWLDSGLMYAYGGGGVWDHGQAPLSQDTLSAICTEVMHMEVKWLL